QIGDAAHCSVARRLSRRNNKAASDGGSVRTNERLLELGDEYILLLHPAKVSNGAENEAVDVEETQTEESTNGVSEAAFERVGDIIMQIWMELREPDDKGNATFRIRVCGLIEYVTQVYR
ncbi:hypothetical protein GOP47_0031149, partial [Adiantum capillus-veneris]